MLELSLGMLRVLTCFLLVQVCVSIGCDNNQISATRTTISWHEKLSWMAEDYFDNLDVIELCKAIEKQDFDRMKELLDEGVDVNAMGRGNMTPLLWAFPDNKLQRFQFLLENGANPNIVFKSGFDTKGGILPGSSITHMVCSTHFPGYFEAVFKNGGDPNLVNKSAVGRGETPLFSLIVGAAENKTEKVKRLIKLGADVNHVSQHTWNSPCSIAVSGGQFQIAYELLKAGADPSVYLPSNWKLAHILLMQKRRFPSYSAAQQKNLRELMEWLENNGESIKQAQEDLDSYDNYQGTKEERNNWWASVVATRQGIDSAE